MRPARLGAAALAVAILPCSASASPLNWPETDTEPGALAFHCAAVMTALGQAYAFANDLLDRGASPPIAALPDHLVTAAGGTDRMGDIDALADVWRDNWESVARTNFYPRLAGDGTPYLADEGRELMLAVAQCADRFDL